jgi:hypothetical protein
LGRGTRVAIVDKHDMMAYKDLILNGHAFTDKGMTRDLTVLPDPYPFLDLNKSTDLGVITNLTAIEVHKVVDGDVLPELHVWGNALA